MPKRSTPPGAGTGVPPEVELDVLVLVLVEVEVEVEVEVLLDPPVDVEVLDDELLELFELFELLEDLLLLEDFEDLDDLLLFELLLEHEKKHLLDLEPLLKKLVASASAGVTATALAVASEAPITAA